VPTQKLQQTLDSTITPLENAIKLDASLQENIEAMTKASDNPTIHCPPFEIFKTSFGMRANGNVCVMTNVIGIKCQSGKAALL